MEHGKIKRVRGGWGGAIGGLGKGELGITPNQTTVNLFSSLPLLLFLTSSTKISLWHHTIPT